MQIAISAGASDNETKREVPYSKSKVEVRFGETHPDGTGRPCRSCRKITIQLAASGNASGHH